MDFLLLLFALPIATIIIASVLETVLRNPIAVAALTFAIYLIVAFAAFDATFLIYVILYTINESKKVIYISHMFYGRRNYLDGGLL